MRGQTLEDALEEADDDKNAAHKVFLGNRVTNTIFLTELGPYSLGMLLAMYEHRAFVQGALLNINSFDQMGVELGKRLANNLLDMIKNETSVSDEDSSTIGLIDFYKNNK